VSDKIKQQTHTTVSLTILKLDIKIVERDTNDTSNTQILDLSLSWLGAVDWWI